MKIPATIRKIAETNGLTIVPIKYRHARAKWSKAQTGYDLVKEIGGLLHIQISIEPSHDSHGKGCWLLHNYTGESLSIRYISRITYLTRHHKTISAKLTCFTVSVPLYNVQKFVA